METSGNKNAFLKSFVDKFKDDNCEPKVDATLRSSIKVVDALDRRLSLKLFCDTLEAELEGQPTGLFMCDFHASVVTTYVSLVERFNGVYHVELKGKITRDIEDNEIYAAFDTPIKAYECLIAMDAVASK